MGVILAGLVPEGLAVPSFVEAWEVVSSDEVVLAAEDTPERAAGGAGRERPLKPSTVDELLESSSLDESLTLTPETRRAGGGYQ